MGQELSTTTFTNEDEVKFKSRLNLETNLLSKWFEEKRFSSDSRRCGLELEAWLVTPDFIPAPYSDEYIKHLSNELVVPEISKYNFELNTPPYEIKGKVFSRLERETLKLWESCCDKAKELEYRSVIIGTLPTLRDYMLTLDQLSPGKRYFALNEQVMKMRNGEPIEIEIEGRDRVHLFNDNVITECAATSLQIHFGVTQESAGRYYNASIVASALIAATCANSPYFYGKELWDESRISIFEQSVNIKSFKKKNGTFATRVSLGNSYVKDSIMELFQENLDGYPVLLPDVQEGKDDKLENLRLHNGTIWRWNRPLIGFDGDTPSLRLEFRIPSSGPSLKDSIANMCFQIAIVEYLYKVEDLESRLLFDVAEQNFYHACRHGLRSTITWLDGEVISIKELLLKEIIPNAKQAMIDFGINEGDVCKYIDDIIKPRVESGQNGAQWQIDFVAKHGTCFQRMLEVYHDYQDRNIPVHLWKV